MLGVLFSDKEVEEIKYLLIREMNTLREDIEYGDLEEEVREALKRRYKRVYQMFSKVASENDRRRYYKNFK
ncbi:hypothetical protein D1872_51660 [compost metagenome]